jgi:hypothetical protein
LKFSGFDERRAPILAGVQFLVLNRLENPRSAAIYRDSSVSRCVRNLRISNKVFFHVRVFRLRRSPAFRGTHGTIGAGDARKNVRNNSSGTYFAQSGAQTDFHYSAVWSKIRLARLG